MASQFFESNPTNTTILVIDDDQQVRHMIVRLLGRAGYTTLQAGDGPEGIELFRLHRAQIDCVLLDLMMPQLNGDRVIAEIRRFSANVPVILMSGHASEEVLRRGEGLADAFLHKPFSPADLKNLIAALLNPPITRLRLA